MTSVPETTHKVTPISTYSWEDGSTTYNLPAMDAGQRWRCAISQATEAARKRFPHSTDRIEKAYELVPTVVLHPATGTATVASSDGQRSYHVNGVCSCPDAPTKAPEGYCKHRLAVVILRKARLLLDEWKQATQPVTVQAEAMDPEAVETLPVLKPVTTSVQMPTCPEFQAAVEAVEPAPVIEAEVVPYKAPVPTVPAQFVSSIKGKPFVQFAGLLTVAHQQGLLSLTERVTHVTDTYVMAEARAEFEDGRVFVGVGDSSPDNVGKEVKPHWRRLAGTRAMARALRNALNVAMVAVEELD
jgi:hypothetical protein